MMFGGILNYNSLFLFRPALHTTMTAAPDRRHTAKKTEIRAAAAGSSNTGSAEMTAHRCVSNINFNTLEPTETNLTWNIDVCLSGLVDVLLLDSTGEAVAPSVLHSNSAVDSVEVIRTSDCLCTFSREEVSFTVQPKQLRLWIPAFRFTQQQHTMADCGNMYFRWGDRT